MKNENRSIFGYRSERSIKIYNRILKVFLQAPLVLLTLFMIFYPLGRDIIKDKPLPFDSPWLFAILYPILIVLSDLFATIVHELGHVFGGFLAGKKFQAITFLVFTIQYCHKTKKIRFYYDDSRMTKDRFIAVGSVLMLPNNDEYSLFKDIFYYLGGSAFNLLAWLLLVIFFGNSVLSFMMLYSGISALIPWRYFSVTGGSDGYYTLSALFSSESGKIYKMQHEAVKYLYSDIKLSSSEIFQVSEFLMNSPYQNNKVLGYYLLLNLYIDNGDYIKAGEYLQKIKDMKETLFTEESFWYDEDEVKKFEDRISRERRTAPSLP